MTPAFRRSLHVFSVVLALGYFAQAQSSLAARIQTVMDRPVFAHSNFGVEFFDLQTGKSIYALNADKMFVPASMVTGRSVF